MKNNNLLNRLVQKLTSARFLIVLILTIVFAIITIGGNITSEFLTIYTMVVSFYFTKSRDENKEVTNSCE